MKKIYLTLLAASISFCGYSQTLTASNYYIIGDVVTYKEDTQTISEGAAGQGQTWNFANLVINTTPTTETYMAPSATPYASSFPNSNLAILKSSDNSYLYFTNTTNDLTVTGIHSTSYVANYPNGETVLSLPASYNTSFTDSFAGTISGAITGSISGVVNYTFDGTGTLILPSGTYTNILRNHTQFTQVINNGIGTLTTNGDNYDWYKPGVKGSLLAIINSSANGSAVTTKVKLFDQTITAIENNLPSTESFSVYPNPAQNGISNLQLNLTETSNVTFTVYNSVGELVANNTFNKIAKGKFMYELNATNYPKGLYFVSLSTNGHKCTQKLVVE